MDAPSPLPAATPSPRTLAAFGLRAVRSLAVPVEQLERLDDLLRAGVKQSGGLILAERARDELGWTQAQAAEILRGLGFAPANRPKSGEEIAWRRRAVREAGADAPAAARAALALRRPRRPQGPAGARPPLPPAAQDRASPRVSEDACRADVWLWRARFFKTRSLAARFVDDGRVRLTRAGQESRLDKCARPGQGRRRPGLRLGRPAHRRAGGGHGRTPRPAGGSASPLFDARRCLMFPLRSMAFWGMYP